MPSDANEDEETFREAIRSLRDRDFGSELALGSLIASVAGDARYQTIAREETAPRAGEMDLHLTGATVVGHSANASSFGVFVQKMADSVKIIARERTGRRRMSSDLLVEPGPGSVRVIFRTPDPVPVDAMASEPENNIWSDPNQQSLALMQVAQLLAAAEPDSPDSETVDGIVESLPPRARPTLVAAVKSISREEWALEGEFRQRGLGVQPIVVSRAGAARLTVALKITEREKATLTTTGHFDGHRRARSLSWFIEDGTGREITAVVSSPELMTHVAEFAKDIDNRVSATFTVLTTHGPGSSDSGSRSFILEDVTPVANTELDIG
jgi:hypothetical protein